MQRRLNVIILAHLWALTPLALVWFLVPSWRGSGAPGEVFSLAVLMGVTAAYLALRTWLTLTGRLPGLTGLWPFIDVALITATLVVLRSPSDAIFALYFIPLASAVASLRLQHIAGVAAAAVLGYCRGRDAAPMCVSERWYTVRAQHSEAVGGSDDEYGLPLLTLAIRHCSPGRPHSSPIALPGARPCATGRRDVPNQPHSAAAGWRGHDRSHCTDHGLSPRRPRRHALASD